MEQQDLKLPNIPNSQNSPKKEDIQCPICGSSFSDLKTHVKNDHEEFYESFDFSKIMPSNIEVETSNDKEILEPKQDLHGQKTLKEIVKVESNISKTMEGKSLKGKKAAKLSKIKGTQNPKR